MQRVPALLVQPPKNWSGVVVLRPQWVQLHVLPSLSVPPGVHTRIGDALQLVLPTDVDTKHAEEVPFHSRESSVQ